MKILLSWLNNWVDTTELKTEELTSIFESLGFEVEEIRTITPNYKNVLIGTVKHIESIKDAEKIRLTHIDIGTDELEIVCGAWNFEEGDKVAVATPGSLIRDKFKIEKRDIMGVSSHGMICSPYELDLWEDKDGILIINENLSNGQLLESCYTSIDTMLDIAITPNRGDAMSHYGLAREIATKTGKKTKNVKTQYNPDFQSTIKVNHGKNSGSSSYYGLEIENVKVKDSPLDLRFKLANVGVRPINNIVDATNYVLFDVGQPLHAFDRDRLHGPVSVRKAKNGEKITTLDDQKRKLNVDDIIIIDNDEPVALAGVMGGSSTQVTDETKNILIESANFDSINILNTSRSLNLISEASIRFERGVDNLFQENGLHQFINCLNIQKNDFMFSNITGTRVKSTKFEYIDFSLDNFENIIGINADKKRIKEVFKGLGFEYDANDNGFIINPPSWRHDLDREIDIIEEVARHLDFETFPSTVKLGNNFHQGKEWSFLSNISNKLINLGFYECYNLSFISKADSVIFTPERKLVRVSNPLDESQEYLRSTSCTHLLSNLSYNKNIGNTLKPLFEIGTSFISDNSQIDNKIPKQTKYLSFTLDEYSNSPDRRVEPRKIDIFYIKSLLLNLFDKELAIEQVSRPGMHSYLSYTVLMNGQKIGWFGKISESSKDYFDLSNDTYIGEFNLDLIQNETTKIIEYDKISQYPFIKFDLSFEVPEETIASEVLDLIHENLIEYENESTIFDEYLDPSTNKRTVGFRIKARSYINTIEENELNSLRSKIISAITNTFSANLKDNE